MFFYTYILKSLKDDDQYVGYTEDLNKRIEKHKQSLLRRHSVKIKNKFFIFTSFAGVKKA